LTALHETLKHGLQQMDIHLPAMAQKKLLDYLSLLHKWNQAYNLTAVNEPHDMLIRHVLDCLAVLAYLPDTVPVLDVGSGAGLPGLVLAIARPEQPFFLLDSLGKRTIFLEKAARDLALTQVTVINARVEMYRPEQTFAVITSRAFSSLKVFLDSTRHLSDAQTLYLAMKGRCQPDEINEIKNTVLNLQTHQLQIPGLEAQRHIISFNRT